MNIGPQEVVWTPPSSVSRTYPEDRIWRSRRRFKPTSLGRAQVDVSRTFLKGAWEDFRGTLWGFLSDVLKFHLSFPFKASIEMIYLNSLQYCCLCIFRMPVVHHCLLFTHPVLILICGAWDWQVLRYNFPRTPTASVCLFIKTSL